MFNEWRTLEEINIEVICDFCKSIVPDHWLFQALDQQNRPCWVCGTCVGLEEE